MRAALQFLTIIPVPAPPVPPGAAAIWFPAVGALLGAMAWFLSQQPMGAALALAALVWITGGLHEDGLADVCDAVRAGRPRERMLEILKDSRIGAYGATAIGLSILLRWQAMSRLTEWHEFVLALVVSRAAMVWLAATTPAASEGLGSAFRLSLPWYAAPLAIVPVVLAAAVNWEWRAVLVAVASIALVRAWLLRRLGGFTGDCLGFQCQVTETAVLIALAWRK